MCMLGISCSESNKLINLSKIGLTKRKSACWVVLLSFFSYIQYFPVDFTHFSGPALGSEPIGSLVRLHSQLSSYYLRCCSAKLSMCLYPVLKPSCLKQQIPTASLHLNDELSVWMPSTVQCSKCTGIQGRTYEKSYNIVHTLNLDWDLPK